MKIKDLNKTIEEQKLNELDDKTYNLRPGDEGYNFELDPGLSENVKEAYRSHLTGEFIEGGWGDIIVKPRFSKKKNK